MNANPAGESPGDHLAWVGRVIADLEEDAATRRLLWGDLDKHTVVRYVDGDCSPVERDRVEKAMRDYPAVKEWVEIVQEFSEEGDVDATVAPVASLRPALLRRLYPVAAMLALATTLGLTAYLWQQGAEPNPPDANGKQGLAATALVRPHRPTDHMGMIIPAYFSLLDNTGKRRWEKLLALAEKGVALKLVVKQPVHNPVRYGDYATALSQAKEKRIEVYGYVNCDGGERKLAEFKKEVQDWHDLYPNELSGIYLDEQEKGREQLDFFVDMAGFIRSVEKDWKILSCANGASDERYLTEAKIDILCQNNSATDAKTKGWESAYDPARFASLIRQVDDGSQIPGFLARAAKAGFGWVYVTHSEDFPNLTFKTLPGYLEDELEAVRKLNAANAAGIEKAAPKEE